MELSKTVAGGGGGRRLLNKFLYGVLRPEVQPLTLLYAFFFHEKGTPLYTFYWQMLPLHIPCLELCMGGGGGILVHRNILPFPLQKQRDHKAWTQPSNVKCTRSSYLHIYNFDNLCYSWFADCSRSTR